MNITTTKTEIKYKSGFTVPSGVSLTVFFKSERTDRVFFHYNGEEKSLNLTGAHNYLTGFSKCPGLKTLERYSNDCVCKTPTGHKTEPDGYGPDGSPSWLLVCGLI